MSKVKLYTVTDTLNKTVLYENKPILYFKDKFELEPRKIAHCAKNNILIDNRYKIVCTGNTYNDYQYYKDLGDLMYEWDKTMAKFRLLLGRS